MIFLRSPAVHAAETFCLGSGSACRYAITFPPVQRHLPGDTFGDHCFQLGDEAKQRNRLVAPPLLLQQQEALHGAVDLGEQTLHALQMLQLALFARYIRGVAGERRVNQALKSDENVGDLGTGAVKLRPLGFPKQQNLGDLLRVAIGGRRDLHRRFELLIGHAARSRV
jgi:hypothetical protein